MQTDFARGSLGEFHEVTSGIASRQVRESTGTGRGDVVGVRKHLKVFVHYGSVRLIKKSQKQPVCLRRAIEIFPRSRGLHAIVYIL